MLLSSQALGTYKHSWKISRAPSEPRNPTSCVLGRVVTVQPPGKGMAGSQVALRGWELHTQAGRQGREGTKEREGAGSYKGQHLSRDSRTRFCLHICTPSLSCVQPGTGQRGWVDCLGWQKLCLNRWSARGRQMWRLPTPSCGHHPSTSDPKASGFFPGIESSLVPCSVSQKRAVHVRVCSPGGCCEVKSDWPGLVTCLLQALVISSANVSSIYS